MTYRPRPGIVMIDVCGEKILAAERRLWAECPQIRVLKGPGVMLWDALDKGEEKLKAVVTLISMFSHSSSEEVWQRVDDFLQTLYNDGYLIRAKEEEPSEAAGSQNPEEENAHDRS